MFSFNKKLQDTQGNRKIWPIQGKNKSKENTYEEDQMADLPEEDFKTLS